MPLLHPLLFSFSSSAHFLAIFVLAFLLPPLPISPLAVSQWHFNPEANVQEGIGQQADTQPRKSHRGFKLLRLNPRNDGQLGWLRHLHESDTNSAPPFFNLDFWQPPSQVGALVDLTVAPNDAGPFFEELQRRQMDYLVIADDLEELIQRERAALGGMAAADEAMDGTKLGREELTKEEKEKEKEKEKNKEPEYRYDRYNPLSRIEEQLYRLREQNPRLMTLFEIGKSHENRSIVTAKISAREISPDERWHPFRGSAIWIDAGIHAREWIAPATAMLLIAKLMNGYNSADVNVRYLVESIDWYITPVLNPDGYEYSHTKNRMWRKNRRPAFCKQQYFNRICCSGVDLNRNFDWFWSITGSSADPCHETYHGPSAFSEPESRAIRNFLEEHPVKAFITLHSYSQMWLIPYGHKKRNYPEDYHTVQRPLSLRAVKALQRLYGTEYQVGSGADLLYEASGSSHDFAKGALNIPFSFLVELRPQNTLHSTGFLLPEAEISDTADETWEAIKVVADKVMERFAPFVEGRRSWKGFNGTTRNPGGDKSSITSTESSTATTTTTTPRPTTLTTPKRTTTKMTRRTTIKKPTTTTTEAVSSTRLYTFQPNTIMTTATPTTSSNENVGGSKGDGGAKGRPSSSSPSLLTSKTLPVATTLISPISVRNNAKITGSSRSSKRGKTKEGSTEGGGEVDEEEEEKEKRPPIDRKTIVNVKICTGGGGGGGSGSGGKKTRPWEISSSSGRTNEEEEEEEEEGREGGEGTKKRPLPENATRRRLVKCRDWSSYCKWWRMHSLCSDARVQRMCTLSCLIECQI